MTGQTFTLTADGVFDHGIGDASCEEGWCGGLEGFPRPCKCGGLIHADFGDEDEEGNFWLVYKCDRCGDDLEPA